MSESDRVRTILRLAGQDLCNLATETRALKRDALERDDLVKVQQESLLPSGLLSDPNRTRRQVFGARSSEIVPEWYAARPCGAHAYGLEDGDTARPQLS